MYLQGKLSVIIFRNFFFSIFFFFTFVISFEIWKRSYLIFFLNHCELCEA